MRQPSRRKRVPRAGEESETQPLFESHKNSKLYNHNMYAEDLAQTHTGSMSVASVSVSPYEPRLVDSVDHVIMVSSIPLAPSGG